MWSPNPPALAEMLPDPTLVRDRLSQLFAEAALLRRLLRLVRAAQEWRCEERRPRRSAPARRGAAHAD